MKQLLIIAILMLLVYAVLQSFTTLNLSPGLVLNSSKYKRFSELSDGVEWGAYRLDRITGDTLNSSAHKKNNFSSVNSIRYFPENNFYLVFDYRMSEGFNLIKIDSLGRKVEDYNIKEIRSFDFIMIDQNGIVATENQVYDLTKDEFNPRKFEKVLNQKNELDLEEWIDTFKKLYKESENVLYSQYSDKQDERSLVYFYHKSRWIKLYMLRSPMMYYNSDLGMAIQINQKVFEPKYGRSYQSYYLKDVQNDVFSNESRSTSEVFNNGAYALNNLTPGDAQIDYEATGKLKLLSFRKKDYTDEGYFNPGIPISFYGPGYYELKIGEETLNFQTVASKTSFRKEYQTDLHLFDLPKEYRHRNKVRFLTYDYHTNFLDNGKKGVYIIRPK